MQTSIEAVYEQGLFRPLVQIVLAEGQHVELAIRPVAEHNGKAESDAAFNLAEMAEDLGITDLATNVDHYLYGLPKQAE
jgi:predicted DNA-binding antitoxin AbrB/MazE fold protein